MIRELIYLAICTIPLLYGCIVKRYQSKDLVPFFIYLIFEIIFDFTLGLTAFSGIKNDWLINHFCFVEAITLALMLTFWTWGKLNAWSMLGVAAFVIFYLYLFIQGEFNSLSSVFSIAQHTVVMFYSSIYIIRRVKIKNFDLRTSQNIIVLAILIFYGISSLTYASVDFLYQENKPSWYIPFYQWASLGFNSITYLIYTYALWLKV